MSTPSKTPVEKRSQESFLVPKLWHGMNVSAWIRLLRKGHFDVAWSRMPMAFAITLFSIHNSVLGYLQRRIYGRRIDRVVFDQPPIFVIGHYRSGTTLLQELLCCDPRHIFPTTYECFSPHHFMLTQRWMAPLLDLILPKQRLADRVRQSTDAPQEDEAAMCCMGFPSRYHRFAFPNQSWGDQAKPDLDHMDLDTQRRWKTEFVRFLKQITLRRQGRMVLKSPQHTCRIKHLLEIFPDARFVYIVRDPQVVFPSTVRLWKVIHESQSLQVPDHSGLKELVLGEFTEMYQSVQRHRPLVGPNRFCEVRYEDLVAQPMEQLQRIYRTLELGDFEPAKPAVRSFLEATSDYRTNRYELDEDDRRAVQAQWAEYMQQYGYGADSAPAVRNEVAPVTR